MSNSGSSTRAVPASSGGPGREEDSDGWRGQIEAFFERWGWFVIRWKWPSLIGSLLVTGVLVSFLPQLTIDNSTEAFLRPDDPTTLLYNSFRDEFGRDDKILVVIGAPDLFDLDFLERLRHVHERFETELPYVVEVESLINARFTRGEAEELVVGELLEDWPETPADLALFRERVLSNPLYVNALISEDARFTTVVITPETYSQEHVEGDTDGFEEIGSSAAEGGGAVYLTAPEADELVDGLHAMVAELESPDFQLHVAGALAMTHRINKGMTQDFEIFLPTTLLMICIALAFLFRRVGGVVLPLMVVVLSLTASIGVMILLEIPGSTAVQILPVFLLTVGVCDAVHILAIAYRARMEGSTREASIAYAMRHSGLAILMTSVTTSVGMASFVTSEMTAVAHLGVLAPTGVFLAFAYTTILLPALLAIFPMPVPTRGRIGQGAFPLEGFLVRAGSFAVRSPWRVIVPTTGLMIIAVLGALQISFSHNGLTWFPEDDRVRRDFSLVDEAMGGSVTLDVLVDSGRPGGLYEPALLQAMDELGRDAAALAVPPIRVSKAVSIVDIVKETHQALNENRPEMRRIPETREAVAQELLLFENSGSDDTEELVDSQFRRARVSLRVPFVDALLFPSFLGDVSALFEKRLAGLAEFEVTGLMTLLSEIFSAVIVSMGRSYVFAICVITPLMMVLLGSLRRGLVSMVPNLIPIVSVLAVMGWLRIPIDTTTMLIGAMVIGIAVDDTIHFMHKFHRYFEDTGDLELAVQETLRTTGSALLFTSIVLMSGFAIFGFSGMTNIRIFGLLSAFAAGVAFLADLLVAPALLSVVEGRRRRKSP